MIFCYFLFLGCFLTAPIIQQNSFKGINFITIPFDITNNQIKITLDSQYSEDQQLQPFLFICIIKPTSTTFMSLLSEEKCFVNWFSYQMKQTQYLILQKESTNKEISNYYQIYQYNESLYIGFQSTYEVNIIVRIQQIISNQCILECQNETECKNQFCNCNFYQVGQDCDLIIDDLTSQQIFQGKKIYYVDVQKGQNESQSVLLEFQNSTTFYGFCITQNFNPNLMTQQNNKTLYISLDQINQCYKQVSNFREQLNSSINYYFLIYFDTNNHTYLESSIKNSDNNQLIIILSTILSSMSFCFGFCLIKQKCLKKQKEPEKENQKYELKHAPSLIDQFFPSQEFAALRNKCEKLVTLNQCLICLDLFYDDSRVRVTYCNHIFHTSCFDKWMNVHKSCPNCRSLFDEESILKYSNQKEAEIFQWSSRTEEVKTTLKPLINETQQQQPQVSQLDSQRNIQAF